MVIYPGLQQTFGLWNKISSKSENFQKYNFWPFRCERQISKIFIYIWNLITQYSYITISNTSRSRDTRKNVDLCNFQLVVEIVLCCNMMEKPIYMVFKWFLKNCLKFFTAKKIGEGAKESLARYTAKKSKRNIKNCGLHTQPKCCFRECNF